MSPAGVAETENVPSTRQISATARARRPPPPQRQAASAPQEMSTTTSAVGNGSTLLRKLGVTKVLQARRRGNSPASTALGGGHISQLKAGVGAKHRQRST